MPYADDPTNRDPRFARPRLRELMPVLAREGLTVDRLALLAWRVRRVEFTLHQVVNHAATVLSPGQWTAGEPVKIEARAFFELPDEIGLRLLGRAIDTAGDEGPVELGKLEALCEALFKARRSARFRRTLAGAVITLARRHARRRARPARAAAAPRNGLNQARRWLRSASQGGAGRGRMLRIRMGLCGRRLPWQSGVADLD